MVFLIILLCVIVMGVGFAVLHYALTHKSAELKLSGWTLVVGALLNLVSMFYYVPVSVLSLSPPTSTNPYSYYKSQQCPGEMMDNYSGEKRSKKMHLQAPPPPAEASPKDL